MNDEETVDAMLETFDTIQNGTFDQKQTEPSLESNDALAVARAEVDRLYEEHRLGQWLARSNLQVAVARWKRRNGVCKYNQILDTDERRFGKRMGSTNRWVGHHVIAINERILEEGERDGFLDTVRHEVAHAVAYGKYGSSQKHNRQWKQLAKKLGAQPQSCSSGKKKSRTSDHKYVYGCPNGCWESFKTRRSKKVKRPWSNGRYCTECGETPVSADRGTDLESLEPGTCAVESIPWSNRNEYRDQ